MGPTGLEPPVVPRKKAGPQLLSLDPPGLSLWPDVWLLLLTVTTRCVT